MRVNGSTILYADSGYAFVILDEEITRFSKVVVYDLTDRAGPLPGEPGVSGRCIAFWLVTAILACNGMCFYMAEHHELGREETAELYDRLVELVGSSSPVAL